MARKKKYRFPKDGLVEFFVPRKYRQLGADVCGIPLSQPRIWVPEPLADEFLRIGLKPSGSTKTAKEAEALEEGSEEVVEDGEKVDSKGD